MLRSSASGSACWDLWPRFTGAEQRAATALIRAAVAYATKHGAPAVEAYPRADRKRVNDEWAFYGTEALFKKAGFKKVRGILPVPTGWTPRVTMRSAQPPRKSRTASSRTT